MAEFLEFRRARCRDCYKCLRECPVKAIDVRNHQATIIEERCILCGHCTNICPQKAKIVHSERETVARLLDGPVPVFASVAPAFIANFSVSSFGTMRDALLRLGFSDAEETAVGARAVTQAYACLLRERKWKNFITSACPAVNRMIRHYYPQALPYLAPVDSPMIAHAKIIRRRIPECRIVFIGPCIAKKREAFESEWVDAVLTFEELQEWFSEAGIGLTDGMSRPEGADTAVPHTGSPWNRARNYPTGSGIIRSFESLPAGYRYVAVDGAERCREALENIGELSGMFLEMSICAYSCINGPCSLTRQGNGIKGTADVREYVTREAAEPILSPIPEESGPDLSKIHRPIEDRSLRVTEREIREILAKTGKTRPEDELNCGACGYPTCREKARAVANGFADLEICLPYMRQRAESISSEIIRNSPNGIVVLDEDLNLVEVNEKARELFRIREFQVKGRAAADFFNPTDFLLAHTEGRDTVVRKLHLRQSDRYVDLNIILMKHQQMILGVMKDITDEVNYHEKLDSIRQETLATADKVILRQMQVAQEIASLLGETTAETKVALQDLKKALARKDELVESEKE